MANRVPTSLICPHIRVRKEGTFLSRLCGVVAFPSSGRSLRLRDQNVSSFPSSKKKMFKVTVMMLERSRDNSRKNKNCSFFFFYLGTIDRHFWPHKPYRTTAPCCQTAVNAANDFLAFFLLLGVEWGGGGGVRLQDYLFFALLDETGISPR